MKTPKAKRTTIFIVAGIIAVAAIMILYPLYLENRIAAGAEKGLSNAFAIPPEQQLEQTERLLADAEDRIPLWDDMIERAQTAEEKAETEELKSEEEANIRELKKSARDLKNEIKND